jgi:hypothetical protein
MYLDSLQNQPDATVTGNYYPMSKLILMFPYLLCEEVKADGLLVIIKLV